MSSEVLVIEDQKLYTVDCNEEVTVAKNSTVTDLVYAAGLRRIRDLDDLVVPPGNYLVKMLVIVTPVVKEEETVEV